MKKDKPISKHADDLHSHTEKQLKREKAKSIQSMAEDEQPKLIHALNERVKELNCLYGLSELIEKPGITLEGIFEGLVNLIPHAWQYPEITCARIISENREFKTDNFKDTKWKQSADVMVYGEKVGCVEVCYLAKKPESYEGPFLKEERDLLEAVTERLGRITERKRAEEKLKRISNEQELLVDNIQTQIWYLKDVGTQGAVNKARADFFGKKKEDMENKKLHDIMSKEEAEFCITGNKEVFEKKVTINTEEWLKNAKGEKRLIAITKAPKLDENGNVEYVVCSGVDISERKLAEERIQNYQERLRFLALQLSLAEEKERHRIATILHDIIVQNLALSKIKLGMLQDKSLSPEFTGSLVEIHDLIEETIQYIRTMTFDISPPILYELSFEAAIKWLGKRILKKHTIGIHFEDDKQPKPLSDDARILLFQSVRELMINIIKHSQAKNVNINIQRKGDDICIEIKDDGVGFNALDIDYQIMKSKSFGLFSIQERLRNINGTIEIISETGQGTLATIVVPLKV